MNAPEPGQKASELWVRGWEQYAAAFRKLSELSVNYYRDVLNVGLNLAQNVYREAADPTAVTTAKNGAAEAALHELIFAGPAHTSATKTFLVSNTTDQPARMSFELSEFVSADGAEKMRVEAELVPSSFELAPRGQRTVECTLPLSEAFLPGHDYRALLRVIGFPQMQVGLVVRVLSGTD